MNSGNHTPGSAGPAAVPTDAMDADGAFFSESRDGRVLSWSPEAEQLYGYAPAEVLGGPVDLLFPDGLLHTWDQTARRVLAGESIHGYHTVHVARDGQHYDVALDVGPLADDAGRIVGITSRVRHYAQRRRTQDVLRSTDSWIRATVENAPDGIITVNEFGIIEYLNPAAERMFGYSKNELLGQSMRVLLPQPFADEIEHYLEMYRTTGQPGPVSIASEALGRHKDGSTFPIELSGSQVTVDGRRIFTGSVHDITSRKRAQWEKDRLLRDLNKRNIEMTCLYRIGESVRSRDVLADIFRDVGRLLRPACMYPEITRVRVAFDGDVYTESPFEETEWRLGSDIVVAGRVRGRVEVFLAEYRPPVDGAPFPREERDLIEVIARVIGETVERREAEAQLIQASKLTSIGELAAGVGHEINNPVNGIMNCADILLGMPAVGARERQFAELIRSEADRIARIVRSLLTFSRQEREHHSPARLCDVVNGVLSLSRTKIAKSNVALHVDVPEDLPRIKCRSEQLQQVVMNLIINALHSLDARYPGPDPDKTLRITAAPVEIRDRPHLRLTVEDHGVGIAPAHMDRLFNPFFTTKGRDVGTGLGLSVSDGIVKDHGGRIYAESEYGAYARFHVELPLDNGWARDDAAQPNGGDAPCPAP